MTLVMILLTLASSCLLLVPFVFCAKKNKYDGKSNVFKVQRTESRTSASPPPTSRTRSKESKESIGWKESVEVKNEPLKPAAKTKTDLKMATALSSSKTGKSCSRRKKVADEFVRLEYRMVCHKCQDPKECSICRDFVQKTKAFYEKHKGELRQAGNLAKMEERLLGFGEVYDERTGQFRKVENIDQKAKEEIERDISRRRDDRRIQKKKEAAAVVPTQKTGVRRKATKSLLDNNPYENIPKTDSSSEEAAEKASAEKASAEKASAEKASAEKASAEKASAEKVPAKRDEKASAKIIQSEFYPAP